LKEVLAEESESVERRAGRRPGRLADKEAEEVRKITMLGGP
jgi:hypothetical protein